MSVSLKVAVFVLVASFAITIYYLRDEPFDPASVQGKRVLITGASSGIGEATAYKYASLGAHVFITARREKMLKQVVARCKELSPNVGRFGYAVADMGAEGVEEMVIQKSISFLGGLDHVILNHAQIYNEQHQFDLWKNSPANYTTLTKRLKTNILSHVHLPSYAMPHVQKTKGNFGITSSIYGTVPGLALIHYATSKHAMQGFFSTLRAEQQMQGTGVSFTLLIFGFIDTLPIVEPNNSAAALFGNLGLEHQTALKEIGVAKTEDAADIVVRSVTLRKTNVFWPPHQWPFYNAVMHLLTT